MKLIYYHFLHLYFISEFEIFFYIYYVMPYENELIYNLFDQKDMSSYISCYNNIYIETFYNKKSCNQYQDKLDNYNVKLINNCIIYIIIINILFFLLTSFDLYQNYSSFINLSISPKNQMYNKNSSLMSFRSSQNMTTDYKKNDDTGIELQYINTNFDKKDNVIEIKSDSKEFFIVYYYKNSKIIKETKKLIQFILIVGIFEYIFFKYIINKYKVANLDTVICEIIEEST
jgi:hypothetical protein